jgi:hypothetical protein
MARSGKPIVQWEYRKILLDEYHRRGDDLDLPGRCRIANWLKKKQDAGENIEKYRV